MVKISSDSTCDLTPAFIKENEIALLPLQILVGEDAYKDSVDIFPKDLVRFVEQEGKTCKTAAVNIYDYATHFENLLQSCDEVVHICLGSKFSSCFQNAKTAAEQMEHVYVVDSCNLSTGHGHLVYQAALMAKEGKSAKEIYDTLQALAPKVEASFVIDKLDYLHRGGRCSSLAKLGANLLQLKPCIEVIDGKMVVGKKYRGSFEKCLEGYVRDRLSKRDDIVYDRIFITHCLCSDAIVEKVKQWVKQYADFEQIIVTEAGCTISSHCGPNTLGILFIRK